MEINLKTVSQTFWQNIILSSDYHISCFPDLLLIKKGESWEILYKKKAFGYSRLQSNVPVMLTGLGFRLKRFPWLLHDMIMHYQCCKSMSVWREGVVAWWSADSRYYSSYPRTPLLCLINIDSSSSQQCHNTHYSIIMTQICQTISLNGNHFHYYQPFLKNFF